MGVPAGVLPTYQFGSTQVFALTGGNPDLQEETTDTYSIGAVIQSPFTTPLLERISASIDWYSIEVTGAVGNLPIIQTIENCFNLNGTNPTYDVNNYYCQVMGKRNPTTGFLFEPGQPALNLGAFKVSGVDLQIDWTFDLADIGLPASAGSLSLGTVVSYVDKFEIQNLPGGPSYNYAGSRGTAVEDGAGVAHPDWKANTTLSYSRDWMNVSLRWRHTAAMISAEQVRNAASTTRGVDSYDVFDLNGRFTLPHDLSVRVGVANLFNKEPPQVGNFAGSFDGQNYDTLGRYYSIAVTKSF
jgi:outer membrane receptor protein involved in Fe transport